MKIGDSKHMARKDIAKLFGVGPTAVTNWVQREKCPRHANGTFDLESVIDWRVSQGAKRSGKSVGLAAEKERLTKAQADAAEINLSLARGDVLPAKDVRAFFSDAYVAIRSRIMSIGQSVAPIVASMDNPTLIKGVIDAHHREALEELADGGRGMGAENAAMAPTATKPVGKRVGRPRKKA